MSESDTMFNERDRRCAAVQLMPLPIQVMTTGPLPAPQNANPGGSTLEGTAQCIGLPFGGGGAEGHRQEEPDQGVHLKGPGNH